MEPEVREDILLAWYLYLQEQRFIYMLVVLEVQLLWDHLILQEDLMEEEILMEVTNVIIFQLGEELLILG